MVTAINDDIYLPAMYFAENMLAHRIANLVKAKCDRITPICDGLDDKQPVGVINACRNSISILTGGPGTGKTTVTRMIVRSFNKAGLKGCVLCPTGRAAKRADEVINENTHGFPSTVCTTIHVGLAYSPQEGGFGYNRHHRLPFDYIIIDEFSMLDLALACDLFNAIDPKKTRVVLVGDQHQLPSVGPGNVARDLINSGVIQTVELTKIFRTGSNSGIAINAQRILHGQSLLEFDPVTGEKFTDFILMKSTNEQDTMNTIISWAHEKIPKRRNLNPLTDIQVLCPGKKSFVGAAMVNDRLRDKINPNGEKFGLFRVGDKVINNRNMHYMNLANGDVGFLRKLSTEGNRRTPIFDFGGKSGPHLNGIVDNLKSSDIDNINLAFAITIHKSQGSEYPCVIIPVHKCHYRLLFRNLLYTGVTRAKQLCAIAGDPAAISICLANNQVSKRSTRLEAILKEAVALAA